MTDINTITISGRLTRDAELKYSESGTACLKFAIASNEAEKKGDQWEERANFMDCVIWGKRGESLAQYLTKGKQVMVTGKYRQDRWEKDGQSHSRVSIIVSEILLVSDGKRQETPIAQPCTNEEPRKRPKATITTLPPSEDGFSDEIPF